MILYGAENNLNMKAETKAMVIKDKVNNCLFCNIEANRIVAENSLAYAILDAFPVTGYHTLVLPKRHVETWFELTSDELLAIQELLLNQKRDIESTDHSVSGFNIGVNNGTSAGQTIFHLHVHLIPRRNGDVENPKGGVRHLIPDKGFYQFVDRLKSH